MFVVEEETECMLFLFPQVFEDVLVYTFRLAYVPTPIKDTSIVRGNSAKVSIQCYYQR